MNPACELLLDEAGGIEADRWLVLGGEAALVSGLIEADPTREVTWQPADVREKASLIVPSAVRNESPGARPDPATLAEVVVVQMPPDRQLTQWWLSLAAIWLAPGGYLLLAGANAEGIRTGLADAADLLGAPTVERYGRKQRLGVFCMPTDPLAAPAWSFTVDRAGPVVAWEDRGVERSVVSQPGVFASDRLDTGTRLLLDALPEQLNGTVLDVGCGAGVIGFTCAWRGADRVDLVDANLLAVQTVERNLGQPGLESCRVLASDVYSAVPDERYDLIVSNPPFHRGKAVDFTVADRLIDEAPRHLNPGGSLLLVANAFLAYGKRMERVFRQVETVAATRQYHVLRASDAR